MELQRTAYDVSITAIEKTLHLQTAHKWTATVRWVSITLRLRIFSHGGTTPPSPSLPGNSSLRSDLQNQLTADIERRILQNLRGSQ